MSHCGVAFYSKRMNVLVASAGFVLSLPIILHLWFVPNAFTNIRIQYNSKIRVFPRIMVPDYAHTHAIKPARTRK